MAQNIAEKLGAMVRRKRTEALRLIKQTIVAAAGGEDRLTEKQAAALAEALSVVGMPVAEFTRYVTEYQAYLRLKEEAGKREQTVGEAERATARANELKEEIEAKAAEERQLRGKAQALHMYAASAAARYEEHVRQQDWLYQDWTDDPPPYPQVKIGDSINGYVVGHAKAREEYERRRRLLESDPDLRPAAATSII